ncbi:MAG TPA: hypothetical protein VE870_13000 [Bacteroidales bacterium]|nr:hypothetical protein [Bacteroidales bacterium]
MMTFKNKHPLPVCIKPVEHKLGEYIAFYRSALLGAAFFVYFRDNFMGSVALDAFLKMLSSHYNSRINLCISDPHIHFKNQALLDILKQKKMQQQTLSQVDRKNLSFPPLRMYI